jgi:hypothetical protein
VLVAGAAGCASTVLEVREDDPANPVAKVPPLPATPPTLAPGFDPKDQRTSSAAEAHEHGDHSMLGHEHHHQHGSPPDAALAPTGPALDGGVQHGGHH